MLMKTTASLSPQLTELDGHRSPAHCLHRFRRWWTLLGATLLAACCLSARPVQAQPVILDCNCLATQAALFTNACCGVIPDLCLVAAPCYIPSPVPPAGYICTQSPPPGTAVCSNTPITFTLIETNSTGFSNTCVVMYYVGFGNPIVLACPTNQIYDCTNTNIVIIPPILISSNTCCTNPVVFLGPFITTNWPVIIVDWIAMQCGVVARCSQTNLFQNTTTGLPCVCLTLICPPDLVVPTCLGTTAGTMTNIFYPIPVVSNICLGVITNFTLTPPPGSPFPVGTNPVVATVMDNLGNSATCTFNVIILGDTTPPTVICGTNQTVQCGTAWAPIPPTSFDNCCSNTFTMLQGITTNVTGVCTEVYEFAWHVTDCNGNFENCTNTVTVTDTTPPVFSGCTNYSVQCIGGTAGGGPWTPVPPTAFDACCSNLVTVSLLSMITNSGTIPCNGTLLLTWQAADCCGNVATCSQTITVADTTPPIITCIPTNRVECGTTPWFGTAPIATDGCCGTNVTVAILNIVTNISGVCFSEYVINWQATDCCGNTATCIGVVQIADTLPPVVICPTNKTVICGSGWTFDLPLATDGCCTNAPFIGVLNTSTNLFPACPLIITQTWLITDCCGNSTNCTQVVTEIDTTPPTVLCGSNQTVQCSTLWAPIPPIATDNCCTNLTVIISGITTNVTGVCTEVYDYAWHVTDCCGNFADCTNSVTVTDTTPPVFSGCTNYAVQCLNNTAGGGPWTPVPPTAFDACCSNLVTVSLLSMITNSGTIPCNGTLLLTWQAADCCGNVATCSQTITVADTTPPIITCIPTNRVECGTTPWFGTAPIATDGCCGTNVTVAILNIVTNISGVCFSEYVINWQATDCCGNTATCIGVVQIADTLPPVVICPTNKTVICGSGWTFDLPLATDGCCTNAPFIGVLNTSTNLIPSCPLIITQTWQITDCCGNSTNCTQIVTEIDTVPPVITCGPNQTLPCSSAWSFIPPTAVDACCASNVTILLASTSTNNVITNCTTIYTAVWSATDCCGNTAHCTNSVTLVDTLPPVLTCRSNYTNQCGSPILPPPATDNCCLTPTVTMLNVVTNGSVPCNYQLTITWEAVDCCTNTATCVEVVTVLDTLAPVAICAPNKTVSCGTTNWMFDDPTATDACCGTNLTITVLSTSPLFGTQCNSSSTRTWQITDCCSNSITCSQTVSVVDNQPPVFSGCGPNQTVQCGTAVFWPPPTASDVCCGTNVTLSMLSNVNTGNACSNVVTETWQATDCCGNVATCSRSITYLDTIPPTILCAPNFTVTNGQPWSFTPPAANDVCCLGSVVVLSTTTAASGCNTIHTRFWRAFDCCGNASPICSQTVTVIGANGPPNDLCQNAIPLVLNGAYLCGSNICATPSPIGSMTPAPCVGSVGYRDVWYTVVAQCTAPMTVDTCAPCPGKPLFDTVVSAYTGNCGSLVQVGLPSPNIGCNDDTCGLQSVITFPAVAGQTYRIRVTGWANAVGWFAIRATQSAVPPINDLSVNAININAPTNLCGTTGCATPTPGGGLVPTPCGLSTGAPDVWYRFTPQCAGAITIDTCGSCPPPLNFNTVLSVYTGIPSLLNQVAGACNDNATTGPCSGSFQSRVTFVPTPGVTYYIRVSGFIAASGQFRLNLTQAASPPPPNDLCANATVVPAGSFAWNNCGANTDGPGNPCLMQNDVWFRYTPPCAGGTMSSQVIVNTCLSTINTSLAVYTGNCGSLSLLACNANATSGSCVASGRSYLMFNVTAGTPYYIRVGSSSPITGSGILNIVGPAPLATPTCGAGSTVWHWFVVNGPGNGTPWAWSVSSQCCQNLRNLNTPGVVGLAPAVATAFAASINAQCPGTAVSFGPFLGIRTRCGPGAQLTLMVGAAGTPVPNLCVVSGMNLPTVGPCSFNPDIYAVEVAGHDMNNNDVDDYIDIATGSSADTNGNLIPDESESCFAPQLVLNPESQSVELGSSVTFTADATGTPPLSYQWLFNGSPIAGATSSNLFIASATAGDLGNYSVQVTNACGSETSGGASLYTLPDSLPVIYDANHASGTFSFTVETKTGFDYAVEYKNDLRDAEWTSLQTVNGSGGPQIIFDSEPHAQMRYYRIRKLPVP